MYNFEIQFILPNGENYSNYYSSKEAVEDEIDAYLEAIEELKFNGGTGSAAIFRENGEYIESIYMKAGILCRC